MSDYVKITELWDRLKKMEDEKRFDGQSYPPEMVAFPFFLTGQGFFPGGDGRWREDSELDQPSPRVMPLGGIVFVGNDFGTLGEYSRLSKKLYENPLTWKHVKARIRRADLPKHLAFFTNAIVGLRKEGKALDKKSWAKMPEFADFCREFFLYQIETIKPRLLVVMGPDADKTLRSAITVRAANGRGLLGAKIGAHITTIFHTTHPYGDFNFPEERKTHDAELLREAWNSVTRLSIAMEKPSPR